MSDPKYNQELILQYLLGTLPEAETQRLDELSITDESFAAALSVAEKDLVDDYILGDLAEKTRVRFESHYLASPARWEKVEFAKAFQVFGQRSSVNTKKPSPAAKAGWLYTLFSSRPVLQWSAGLAVLILLALGALLVFQNVRLRRELNTLQAQHDAAQQRETDLQRQLANQQTSNTATEEELARVRAEQEKLAEQLKSGKQAAAGSVFSMILTPQMRGNGQIKTVTLVAPIERIATQLQLEPNSYSTYSVELIDESNGRVIWRSGKLKATGTGDTKSVSASFRADLLRAGTYRLQVSGISPTGTAEVINGYPFKVIKQ